MMLSKPLVSFVAAFAVATCVSAAATPMARDVSGSCNVGSVSCCDATFTKNDPFVASLGGLLGIPLNVGALLGLNCFNLLGSTQCNTSPVCCKDVTQTGLINVGCSPLNIGL